MQARYEYYRSKGKWFFNLITPRGKVIAISSQRRGYGSKASMLNGIESCQKHGKTKRVVQVDY